MSWITISSLICFCLVSCISGPLHPADRRHKRAHHPGILWLVFCLAADLGFGAARGLHRRARRAALRLWARDNGASLRWRARRAGTDLARLIARADTRRARRYRRLQNIARHIGRCGALRLQHIARHIGLRCTRRNRGLQHILGPVYRWSFCRLFASTRSRFIAADLTIGLRDIDKCLDLTFT